MIRDLILQYCENNDITQEQLSQRLGIPFSTLCNWIHNNRLPTRGINYYCGVRLAKMIGYSESKPETVNAQEHPKKQYNYRCLDNTYEPDCLHCVWHKDCGDDIVFCAKPGALCVNARR